MKSYFLNLRTNSSLKKNKAPRETIAYPEAKTIGLVFTVEDRQKHDQVKEFIHRLEKDGKKVSVISFLPKDRENYEFKFDFFTQDDITFWGEIRSNAAAAFCQSPFDYVYYLDLQPNPVLLNLLARSKARCRFGRHWQEGQAFFELMIESQPSIYSLLESFYRYSACLK